MVGGYLISRENKMYKCECRAWKFQKGVTKNDRTCKHTKELHAAGGAADPRHWTVAAPVPSRKHGTAPADSTQTKRQKTSAVDLTADDSNLGLPTAAERTDELFPILSSLASSWGPQTTVNITSISLTNKAAYTDCTVSTPGGSMFAVSWRAGGCGIDDVEAGEAFMEEHPDEEDFPGAVFSALCLAPHQSCPPYTRVR